MMFLIVNNGSAPYLTLDENAKYLP